MAFRSVYRHAFITNNFRALSVVDMTANVRLPLNDLPRNFFRPQGKVIISY